MSRRRDPRRAGIYSQIIDSIREHPLYDPDATLLRAASLAVSCIGLYYGEYQVSILFAGMLGGSLWLTHYRNTRWRAQRSRVDEVVRRYREDEISSEDELEEEIEEAVIDEDRWRLIEEDESR